MTDHREILRNIRTFPQLIKYLRDELDWPIHSQDFDDLVFEYTPEELGIYEASAAKIQEIKRLRPLSANQPWGIFFIKFEPKWLPVVALRRVLSRVVLKKRASANSSERMAWKADDLLFVSNYGEGSERCISFAHFSQDGDKADLPTLKVLGWDNLDTPLHLDHIADVLRERLAWPEDEEDAAHWRESWRSAFTLRHREVITTSKELAVRLAELARAIRDRIRTVLAIETENGPLTKLMKAFQEALIHDLDADAFADMYAQTIAYGLLSARVTNPNANTADGFAAQLPVTNPFLKELMETFLHVGGRKGKAGRGSAIDFDELGVSEVVELLDDANMEAVVRDFGDRNQQEDPVIHFYELFLKEYDAKKRMQRGVFYTPRPVVSYIVRSVHELLQTEFGLSDGLADSATWGEMAQRHKGLTIPDDVKPTDRFVTILDPATGTGTFLVEAIDVIHRTLVEKWQCEGHGEKKILDLWNDYVPKHLLPRLHGYELLMAPYAIAHLKIGLKLHETGYRFESDERARIYLTNALEPAHDSSGKFEFMIPALAHEAQAVNAVKRHRRFTVVIGNPPYSGISVNMTETAQALVMRYRFVNGEPLGERKLWLQNDYVKFLGLSHAGLVSAGVGCLGYITDNSYLDGPTFRGVRSNLLADFDRLCVLNLQGSAKKKGVSGASDENVFDITQGVAVVHAVRLGPRAPYKCQGAALSGDRGTKYTWLSRKNVNAPEFKDLAPVAPFFLFVATDGTGKDEYSFFQSTNAAFPVKSVGVQTSRDHLAIEFTRRELIAKIRDFASREHTDTAIRERYFPGKCVGTYRPGDTRGWSLASARKELAKGAEWERDVVRILYRPFDFRYVLNSTLIVDWPRPEVSEQMRSGENVGLCLLRRTENSREYDYFSVTRDTVSNHQVSMKDGTYLVPLFVSPEAGSQGSLGLGGSKRPNYSAEFLRELRKRLGLSRECSESVLPKSITPEEIFHYVYAVFVSPNYRTRYAEFLKIDFPRLPLTSSLKLFHALTRLGGELVSLHLVEAPVQLALSARYDKAAKTWRYEVAKAQRLPVTLSFIGPEKPMVSKVGWSENTVWIDAVKSKKGEDDTKVTGTVGFRGVTEEVWNFHIGGYQVCEKWLKDRKDRTLAADDIAHYHRIVIALHETIRLMREIDEVIEQHGGWPGAFITGK